MVVLDFRNAHQCAWCIPSILPLLLVGCVEKGAGPAPGQQPEENSTSAPASSVKRNTASTLKGRGGYEVVEVPDGGSLSVTVLYTLDEGGSIPTQTEVPVDTNIDVCGHKVFTESLIVDAKTLGLKNAVVRLEGISKGKAPPAAVTVDNKDCAFHPHVTVAMKGTQIAINNSDSVLHTTHPYIDGINFFNLPLPPGATPPRPRPIPRSGLMSIRCDVHKWMQGYMVVHTNPYIAVTDAQGRLEIEAIPPGKYSYVAWHEQLGEKKGEVEIVAGKPAELKLAFEAPN
jgi:hypothetical protein